METATERWARWKRAKPSSPTRGRAFTKTEQKRRAQRESVKARLRNAAEIKRRARKIAKTVRDEIKALEDAGMDFIAKRLPDELRKDPPPEAKTMRLPVVEINWPMLALIQAISSGRLPPWVRAISYSRERLKNDPRPPKVLWHGDEDYLKVAISVENITPTNDPSAPYWHHGHIYYYKAHDFLNPAYIPGGSVSWMEVLKANRFYLRDLPLPPLRKLVKAIVGRWLERGRDKSLPWQIKGEENSLLSGENEPKEATGG